MYNLWVHERPVVVFNMIKVINLTFDLVYSFLWNNYVHYQVCVYEYMLRMCKSESIIIIIM